MEENKKTAIKVASAIMPIMEKTLQGLADRIISEYNDALDKAQSINEKLEERMLKLNEELNAVKASNESAQAALSSASKKNIDLQKQLNEMEKQLKSAQSAQPIAKEPAIVPQPKPQASDGIKHHKFAQIMRLLKKGNVFLGGAAGCGKSKIAEQIAEEMGLPFYVSSQITQEYQIEGFVDAHGVFNSVPFYEAFSKGGVFVLEEMDASTSEVLVKMNTALANGYLTFPGKGLVRKHKDFHCIATGNTYGTGADSMYTGRVQLDSSTLDRFRFVEVDYDVDIELAIAKGNKELIQFVHDLRRAIAVSGANIPFVISYRGISDMTEDEEEEGIKEAMKIDIIKGIDDDNVELLYNNLLKKDNKYARAFKACANVLPTEEKIVA